MGRLGGEEFAILLPNAPLDAAVSVAERMRQRLLTTVVSVADATHVTVTASFGVSAFRPQDTYEDLLGRADAGLYRAKKAGRDRVVVVQGGDQTIGHDFGRVCAA